MFCTIRSQTAVAYILSFCSKKKNLKENEVMYHTSRCCVLPNSIIEIGQLTILPSPPAKARHRHTRVFTSNCSLEGKITLFSNKARS